MDERKYGRRVGDDYGWEYAVATCVSADNEGKEEFLNWFGQRGWECYAKDGQVFYFRREKDVRNDPVPLVQQAGYQAD